MEHPYREQAEPSVTSGDERRTRYIDKPATSLVGTKQYYARVCFSVEGVRAVTVVEHTSERRVTLEVEGGEQWAVSKALSEAAKLVGIIIELEWTK